MDAAESTGASSQQHGGITAKRWVSSKKSRGVSFVKYCFRGEKAIKGESAPREDENQPKLKCHPRRRFSATKPPTIGPMTVRGIVKYETG